MRNLGLSAFLIMVPAVLSAQQTENNVLVLNQSKLTINGTSNVTDFQCQSTQEFESDTLNLAIRQLETQVEITKSTLILEVSEFDCGRKGINRDFRQTLKYREHPSIHISLNGLITSPDSDYPDAAIVDITIAGITRAYRVNLYNVVYFDKTIYAAGHQILNISDFGLEPPSPMLGLIKVHDELKISFDLVIREL